MLQARIGIVTLTVVSASVAFTQENLTRGDYVRTEAMISMRDGVKLFTVIVQPKKSKEKLPIIFERTPYGVDGHRPETLGPMRSKEGFIFVFQDIRGRYKSEGKFVMVRPTTRFSGAKTDEGTDAYDTIDWLVKHLKNCNGRVGMEGVSYDGWTTLEASVSPHPALKVAFPMASPLDMFVNDDFHRNGAFRLSYGFEYSYLMETSKVQDLVKFDEPDLYDWYLKAGPLSNITKIYGSRPTWQGFFNHPNHDSYWSNQSVASLLETPKVPIIHVGGWWDQEDPFGPQECFRLLAKNDPKHWNHIVLGPWNHGGWMRSGTTLGDIDFGTNTALEFQQQIFMQAFLYYLKGRGDGKLPTASIFVTGSNKWKSFDAWPPRGVRAQSFFLGSLQTVSTAKPTKGAYDEFVSDPAKPVPYRKRPIEMTYEPKGSGWYEWQVQDQRFLSDRKDVLTYRGPVLDHDISAVGDAKANFWASTSGTDCDWVVKIIDEYPADDAKLPGYQLPISMEVIRARFRNSLERPEAVRANHPTEYHLDMHGIGHTFLKGHRVLVQIQSSWFPLIDRNPQTFVPNIYRAKAADFRPAVQRVYHSASMPSRIELPILGL